MIDAILGWLFPSLRPWLPFIHVMRTIAGAKELRDAAKSGELLATIKQVAPDLVPLLDAVAAKYFPQYVGTSTGWEAGASVLFQAESVKKLQAKLNGLGYRDDAGRVLDVDGVYGWSTLQATKRYQAEHGLDVDGWAGPATWVELDKTK